jgi:hypothetical protein
VSQVGFFRLALSGWQVQTFISHVVRPVHHKAPIICNIRVEMQAAVLVAGLMQLSQAKAEQRGRNTEFGDAY